MRIIGEAGVRLTASSRGLGIEMRGHIERALKEATAGLELDLTRPLEKDADRSSNKIHGIFSRLFAGTSSLVSGFNNAVAAGTKLTLIGAAAGVGLAGVSSLITGVVGLIGALGQAAGAAGLLPAALLAAKAVSATLQIGLAGVSDSLKALGQGDMQAFAESLKGLAPEAQKAIGSLGQFHGQIEAIKKTVQNNLFAGLQKPLDDLAAKTLPQAKSLFSGIATSINGAAKETLGFLNTAQSQGLIISMVGNVKAAVAQLAPAFKPAISAFLDISSVGSSFLPQIAGFITKISTAFGDFIRRSAANGQLAEFFQTALDAIEQFGRVLGNLGSIFGSVFKAANAAGGGFLNTLVAVTGQLATFLKSAQGQSALTSFFTSMRDIIGALLPVILSVVSVVANTLAPIFADLARIILPVLNTVIQQFGSALAAARPGITALAQGIASLLEVFGPTITFAVQLAGILGGVLGKVLQTLAPVLARVANALLNGLIAVMPTLEPIILAIADSVVQLIDAAIPLVPLFFQVVAALLPLLPPLIQLVAAVLPPLISLVQSLVPIIQAFAQILVALIPPITAVVTTILNILIPPIQLIAAVVAQVAQLVASAFTAMSGAVTEILTVLGSIISGIWQTIVGIFTGAVNAIGNAVRAAFDAILSTIGRIMSGIGNAVKTGLDGVIGFFRDLPGKVLGFLGNLASDAVEAGANIIRGIIRGLGNLAGAIFDKIKAIVSNAWNAVLDFFGIGSPSKLAEETFRWVGIGAVKGLEGVSGQVTAAAMAMAGDAMAAMAGQLGGPTGIGPIVGGGANGLAGSLGGGVILNQTNVMLPGADVQQFAAEVSRRGAQRLAAGTSSLPVTVGSVQAGMAPPNSLAGVGGI